MNEIHGGAYVVGSDSSTGFKTNQPKLMATAPPQFFGTKFDVPEVYTDLTPIGMGSFGLVCSATHSSGGKRAIKKVGNCFANAVLAKRSFRELALLSQLRNENVITITDVFLQDDADLYFVTELLNMDLQRLIQYKQELEPEHIKYFTVYNVSDSVPNSQGTQVRTFGRRDPPRSEAVQSAYKRELRS
jgi:serine/threonine protein kinase